MDKPPGAAPEARTVQAMADLLNPQVDHTSNYVHQLRTTLNAYLPAYIYIGEALQNALDATRELGPGDHAIEVLLDFPAHRVLVRDQGPGFPNEPRLLFLGGGTKHGRKYGGLVGVGLKVVLFSSSEFTLRAKGLTSSLRYSLNGANQFDREPRPDLRIPDVSFDGDPAPLGQAGTEIAYSFPPDLDGIQTQFLRVLLDETAERSFDNFYLGTLANAVTAGAYPNRFAAMLALYLQRYSYLGLTNTPPELAGTRIDFAVNIGSGVIDSKLEGLADGQDSFSFTLKPQYATVDTTVGWVPAGRRRPVLTDRALLNGGQGLSRTDLGFNRTAYNNAVEYEGLLRNSRGKMAVNDAHLATYRARLFPRINSIQMTIGRIQELERYLPGGAKHVLSANGVVTSHAVEFNRGQNQQYVRCFDVAVDVDAELNYGKTQLNDMHLVGLFRRFLNDAYAYSIQNATRDFVGKQQDIHEDTNDEFFGRPDLTAPLTQVKVPRSENDVIALLFELAGRGLLPDYRWFGLSGMDTYDSRAVIRRPGDSVNYLDSLGESKLRIVEFKLRAASIARDFMRESKDPKEVDLIVAYELGVVPAAADVYQVLEIDQSQAFGSAPDRVFPGVSHVIYDATSGAEVQILLVQRLLNEHFPEPPPAGPLPADVIDED